MEQYRMIQPKRDLGIGSTMKCVWIIEYNCGSGWYFHNPKPMCFSSKDEAVKVATRRAKKYPATEYRVVGYSWRALASHEARE